MTVLIFEPKRQADFANLQTELINYANRIEKLLSPNEVLEELHAVTTRHLPLSVMGAVRLPLKSGDWESIQLGKLAFLHKSELSRIPRRLVGLSQAASAAGSSRAA